MKSVSIANSGHNVEILDFSATRILREIYFAKFWASKTAILKTLEAMNFDFWLISALKKEKFIKTKFREPVKLL